MTCKTATIRIGNTYEPLSSSIYQDSQAFKWKIYAQPLDSSISLSNVTYELHPSFSDSIVELKQAPFILERVGWGTFEVTVHLDVSLPNSGESVKHTLKWMLQAESQDSSQDFQLELPQQKDMMEDEDVHFDLDLVVLDPSEATSNYNCRNDPYLDENVLDENGEDDKTEFADSDEQLDHSAQQIAYLLKHSKHPVVYTGAGISTSANLGDFRGPNGAWTLRDQGRSHEFKSKDFEQAYPTYAHYALSELVKREIVKYVVSTNMDGLHRRSGVLRNQISELHGNCYRELCSSCNKEYLRGFDTTKSVKNWRNHITGRKCSCGGKLKDTIIHFTENLPEQELNDAWDHSEKSDFALVLGTSMRVQPSCRLPSLCKKQNGKMVIVNLQKTPYDHVAYKKVYAKTDEFMRRVMQYMGIDQVDETYDMLRQ